MTKEEIAEELAESVFQYSSTLDEMPLNLNWLMDSLHREVEMELKAKIKSRTIDMGENNTELSDYQPKKEWEKTLDDLFDADAIQRFRNKGLGI